MQWKNLTLLAVLLAAAPALAREAESGGGGNDDPANHDAGDDNGGDRSGSDDGPGDDNGGSGSGSGSGGGGDWIRARNFLVRDAAASDGDVYGHVEVRTRGTRQRFQVEAERLTPGDAVEVLVADAADAMVSAGTATAGVDGEAELELDTGDGASLPAGAATVAELAGRRVEVRDAAGGLLLSGSVPSLDGGAANQSGRTRVRDDVSGVRVKVEMRVRGRDGRQEFRVEVKKAASGAVVELWIDDGQGTMVKASESSANGGGNTKVRLDSRRGDGMPLGVAGLQDLSGRAFEVRVSGVTVASGNLPTL